jgi:hypothetical protein
MENMIRNEIERLIDMSNEKFRIENCYTFKLDDIFEEEQKQFVKQ